MNKIKTSALLLSSVMCVSILGGCIGPIGRAEQKSWVKEMNKVYEDDHFEYLGPQSGEAGQRSDIADVSSELLPSDEYRVYVKKANGELLSNYNRYRYEEEIQDYFHDYLDDWFDDECDSFVAIYVPTSENDLTPIEDISAKKFIKKYVDVDKVQVRMCCSDGDYPDEEVIKDILIDIVEDRGGAKTNISVLISKKKYKKNKSEKYDVSYSLCMKEDGEIDNIYVSYLNDGGESHYLLENYEI